MPLVALSPFNAAARLPSASTCVYVSAAPYESETARKNIRRAASAAQRKPKGCGEGSTQATRAVLEIAVRWRARHIGAGLGRVHGRGCSMSMMHGLRHCRRRQQRGDANCGQDLLQIRCHIQTSRLNCSLEGRSYSAANKLSNCQWTMLRIYCVYRKLILILSHLCDSSAQQRFLSFLKLHSDDGGLLTTLNSFP
jgi:hypothetical protein